MAFYGSVESVNDGSSVEGEQPDEVLPAESDGDGAADGGGRGRGREGLRFAGGSATPG